MGRELPQPVLEYLASQKTVTLATASADGVPHARTYMYANDGPTIYFWARPTSTTAAHLQTNPRVSFTIDEYVQDWNKAKGIQGHGHSEQVSSATRWPERSDCSPTSSPHPRPGPRPPTSPSSASSRRRFSSSTTAARGPASATRSSAWTSIARRFSQARASRHRLRRRPPACSARRGRPAARRLDSSRARAPRR